MFSNLSAKASTKKSAQNILFRLISPMLRGFFRDNCWKAPSQLFNAINALGGVVEVNKTEYFGEMAGKRWFLEIEANGFKFPATLTATFADMPNGEVYDLTLTVQ